MDPSTGALRWEKWLEVRPGRILVAGGIVFLATHGDDENTIRFLDLATGADRGAVELGYRVNAALVVGDLLYFSGAGGMIALSSDGRVQFRVDPVMANKSLRENDLVATMANGSEMWRIRDEALGGASLLSLGEQVAQTDIDM